MKSIVFTEDQLDNIQQIGQALFDEEQDPRSVSYVRKLNRPTIQWFWVAAIILGFVAAVGGAIFCVCFFDLPWAVDLLLIAGVTIAYVGLTARRAAIWAVKIYQRYAPGELRNKCRFEPSCSEYMLLAIEKYGLIKGAKKGINRLKRCNVSGGGIDYP